MEDKNESDIPFAPAFFITTKFWQQWKEQIPEMALYKSKIRATKVWMTITHSLFSSTSHRQSSKSV